jgi:hypothetical protein
VVSRLNIGFSPTAGNFFPRMEWGWLVWNSGVEFSPRDFDQFPNDVDLGLWYELWFKKS